MKQAHVIVIGGGFAGMGCAEKLAANPHLHVTLIDKNNYHKFTPLLYQVAASTVATEAAAIPFRHYFAGKKNIDIKMASVTSVDPEALTVSTQEGETYRGDYLVLAAGNVVNFFGTPGAEQHSFPLYTLADAERLRSRIISSFEDADRNPGLIGEGALNFVIVGAGPTGTEVAGALADMLHLSLPKEFNDLALTQAKIYLVNHGKAVLGAFSEESQKYAADILTRRGVKLVMGTLVENVTDSYVELTGGEKIVTKTVIWAGGLKAPTLAASCGLPQKEAGRIALRDDLTVEGYPRIYALGDFGVIPGRDGKPLPQLASVAKQTGEWAARNILAQIGGKAQIPFQYDDKGIMAMIGKDAAVVEIGEKRRGMQGYFAYFTWLGVHVLLLSTFFQKVQALIGWTIDYFSTPAFQLLDSRDDARVKWTTTSAGTQKPKDDA